MKLGSLICGAIVAVLIAHAPAMAQPLFGKSGPNFETAGPNDIRVYVTTAMAATLTDDLLAQADRAVGKHVAIAWGSARGSIQESILAHNGDFELAIVVPDVNENALAKGKVKPGTYDVAVTPVALQIKGDATVDVSSPEAVKKTLLGATAVRYSPTGAALLTVRKILADLQLDGKIKNNEPATLQLTGNQYEMGIYPLSEIIVKKDVRNLGPVVRELQVPAIMQASIGVRSRDDAGAKAFLAFLQTSATDSAFKATAFEKPAR